MTYLPTEMLPERSPAPEARGSSLTVYISWLVIVLCVGYIFYKVYHKSKTGSAAMEAQVELNCRYMFGASQWFPSDATRTQYAGQMSDMAKTQQDRLLIATVLAELRGKDAVTQYINDTDNTLLTDGLKRAKQHLLKVYQSDNVSLSSAERDELKQELGWCGKLALTWQMKESEPARAEVLQDAHRTAATLVGAFVVIIGLLGIGLILGILALIFSLTGVIHSSYVPGPPPASAYVEGFALFLALYVGVSFAKPLLEKMGVAGLIIMQVAIFSCALWPLVRGVRFSDFRMAAGWHMGKGLFTEIGCGLVGYLSGLPIVALGALTTFILVKVTHAEQPIHPIAGEANGGFWNAVMLYVAAAVLAPVMEETLFRGLLYHHTRTKLPWALAAVIVGIIFASIHPQGWAAIPVLGSIGFVLAMIREWRGSLIASVTAHAFNNGMMVTMLILVTR